MADHMITVSALVDSIEEIKALIEINEESAVEESQNAELADAYTSTAESLKQTLALLRGLVGKMGEHTVMVRDQ